MITRNLALYVSVVFFAVACGSSGSSPAGGGGAGGAGGVGGSAGSSPTGVATKLVGSCDLRTVARTCDEYYCDPAAQSACDSVKAIMDQACGAMSKTATTGSCPVTTATGTGSCVKDQGSQKFVTVFYENPDAPGLDQKGHCFADNGGVWVPASGH
jgi:hypothetical protein